MNETLLFAVVFIPISLPMWVMIFVFIKEKAWELPLIAPPPPKTPAPKINP